MISSSTLKIYNILDSKNFNFYTIVKVAVRIHYSNTDRLLRHWVYSGNQLMFSLFWVPNPESTARNMMRRIVTPIMQQSKLRPCLGEGIYAVSRLTFLLASKNHDVDDDQLYFMSNSINTEPHLGGFVYRTVGLLLVCGIIPNRLRPVT
jgi:hypothetical protein